MTKKTVSSSEFRVATRTETHSLRYIKRDQAWRGRAPKIFEHFTFFPIAYSPLYVVCCLFWTQIGHNNFGIRLDPFAPERRTFWQAESLCYEFVRPPARGRVVRVGCDHHLIHAYAAGKISITLLSGTSPR